MNRTKHATELRLCAIELRLYELQLLKHHCNKNVVLHEGWECKCGLYVWKGEQLLVRIKVQRGAGRARCGREKNVVVGGCKKAKIHASTYKTPSVFVESAI